MRLQIYGHVFNASLIHVHRHVLSTSEDGVVKARFTWTPCRAPNPKCTLFCENPKWSGLCEENDRCTFKPNNPPEVTGFKALIWTCKSIQQETQEFFLRNTTVSIHPNHVREFLDYLDANAPRYIGLLQRITLAGPNTGGALRPVLEQIKDRLPNLQAVAFQGQVPKWTVNSLMRSNDPRIDWRNWYMVNEMKCFDRHITVAMEGLAWAKRRRHQWQNAPDHDEQTIIRIVREGRESRGSTQARNVAHSLFTYFQPNNPGANPTPGWTDDDVDVEGFNSELVAYKRNAQWRKWWRSKELKRFV